MDSNGPFKCRVLIVDDEPLILETTSAIVRSFGYSVRSAPDGFAALKILREVLPDLIIADLRMPNMSGFELLSIMRRRFPHIPTIAISGEFILATMPLGLLVDHFFQKGGYTPAELNAKIKELIADSMIAKHRPGRVFETGLLVKTPEKNHCNESAVAHRSFSLVGFVLQMPRKS